MRFNLFLALMALMALGVLCGCQTDKKTKIISVLRVHMEANSVNGDTTQSNTAQSVTILRSNPVLITINKEPFLTEANIIAAAVIEARGGFAIQIQFDEMGALTIEQCTASNPGKHYAVFGQWANKRRMAAGSPLRSSRIALPTASWHSPRTCRGLKPTGWCSASTTSQKKSARGR